VGNLFCYAKEGNGFDIVKAILGNVYGPEKDILSQQTAQIVYLTS
jgi:hypothetical protein